MVNTESRVYVPDFAVSTEEHDAAIVENEPIDLATTVPA